MIKITGIQGELAEIFQNLTKRAYTFGTYFSISTGPPDHNSTKKWKKRKWEKRKYENENRKEKIVFLDGLHTNDEKWGRKKFIKREDAHQYFPLRSPSASSMIAIQLCEEGKTQQKSRGKNIFHDCHWLLSKKRKREKKIQKYSIVVLWWWCM